MVSFLPFLHSLDFFVLLGTEIGDKTGTGLGRDWDGTGTGLGHRTEVFLVLVKK